MKQIKVDINFNGTFEKPIVACIGYFDGLHLGHKALIDKTCALAKERNCESALITFSPDPWVTIKNLTNIQHISTFEERMERMEKYGIENVLILAFTKEMAAYTHEEFSAKLLHKIPIKALVCGFDFHYGLKGQGNCVTLAEEGKDLFDVNIVESVDFEGEKISSTRISQAVTQGNMQLVYHLLGYPFSMQGVVVAGRQQGRAIGFPTANIDYQGEYICPLAGIYIGMLELQGVMHQATINIGHNPTFNHREDLSLEAYILDFEQDIYGKEVRVYFMHRIRDEIRFNQIFELQAQMDLDVCETRNYFKENKNLF